MDFTDRFWAKVEKSDGCWLWTATTTKGYGIIRVGARTERAHRLSFEMHRGPIPAGLVLDHLCRVRNCVNPDHLEPVTQAENTRRSPIMGTYLRLTNGTKTHCPRGHAYDETNTRVYRTSRICRACRRVRYAEAKAAR